MMVKKSTATERGSISIEVIGVVGLMVVVAIIAVQGIFAAQLGSVTESAARDGARALVSSGADPNATVANSLPGWAQLRAVKTGGAAKSSCGGVCVAVEADYVIGFAGLGHTITVERVAELPGS